jgi:SAM-dependent methyltransferase
MGKIYDRDYFERWYRPATPDPRAAGRLTRKVALAVAACEYHLGRRLRSVLDIGCGEGAWRAPLRRLRPGLDYMGLDSSHYAVARYGRSRNLKLVDFAQLGELRFAQSADLLVCSDVVHYLDAPTLRRGLAGFAELGHGLAFIELFCRGDHAEGDEEGWLRRPASFYRRLFSEAGLLAVGNHCYLLPHLHSSAVALERADGADG